MIRVAVVGSGPAGIYTAESLAASGLAEVDVLDRVPCPYGLVRYGVAPDHERIRSISGALAKVFEHPAVRFLGNVEFGRDLDLADLHRHYDAVVICSGASAGRRLGLPGDALAGSFTATEFVSWYCGHPDTRIDAFTDTARSVAVVGMGNVAVDVARILLRPADELAGTDIPQHVLDVLAASPIEQVHLIGRRGPAEAKWTTRELRELGAVTGTDVVLDPAELVLDEAAEARVAAEPVVRRNLEVLREFSTRTPVGHPRRLQLHFLQRPLRVTGERRVTGVEVERCELDGTGGARPTGKLATIGAGMLVASVGYRGTPLPGLPFDAASATIPHELGRVVRVGAPAGDYVAGWIKRGPSGVIGTNKHDAHETVHTLLEDAAAGRLPPRASGDRDEVLAELVARGVPVVDWQGWRWIEAAETAHGAGLGRARTKIVSRAALLAAAGGTAAR